jgi:hypothetical protein
MELNELNRELAANHRYGTNPSPSTLSMAGRLGFFPSFDVKLGGNQIEYEDEDPVVPQMFQEACDKAGVQNLMVGRNLRS